MYSSSEDVEEDPVEVVDGEAVLVDVVVVVLAVAVVVVKWLRK